MPRFLRKALLVEALTSLDPSRSVPSKFPEDLSMRSESQWAEAS